MDDQDALAEEQAILAAIEQHTATFDEIARRIEQIADPVRAYRLADRLTAQMIGDRKAATALRLRQVRRMNAAGAMTYAEIGKVVGVTKQRVKGMLNQLDRQADTAAPPR